MSNLPSSRRRTRTNHFSVASTRGKRRSHASQCSAASRAVQSEDLQYRTGPSAVLVFPDTAKPKTTTTTAPQITIINNNNNNNSSCGRTYTNLVFDYPSCCGSQFTTPVLILRLVLLLVLVAVIVGIALPTRSLLFCSVLFYSASVPVQLYLLSLITCHPLRASFLSALSINQNRLLSPSFSACRLQRCIATSKAQLAPSPSALPIHSFFYPLFFPLPESRTRVPWTDSAATFSPRSPQTARCAHWMNRRAPARLDQTSLLPSAILNLPHQVRWALTSLQWP